MGIVSWWINYLAKDLERSVRMLSRNNGYKHQGATKENNMHVFKSARSISVINGRVIVDGKTLDDSKEIHITVEGDCERIEADACSTIEVRGNVRGDVKTMSGDVRCGDVLGHVNTMSGDVIANDINGGASSMSGDIRT